jgi:hypothetical protein
MVLSSDTRKAATLDTQNTGQGEAGAGCTSPAVAATVEGVTNGLHGAAGSVRKLGIELI